MDEFNIVVEDEKTVDVSGELVIDFLKGEKGDKGDSSELTIGTVENGDVASASITGVSPNQVLNLVLPKGDKGDTGKAFSYEDFTEEQLASLKGAKGDIGLTGPKGDKGDTGKAFSYEDFTEEQLALLKGAKGDIGLTGPKGDKGDNGEAGYTPVKGVDYFTDDDIEQIKQDGIVVSTTEPTENRRKVWIQNVDSAKKIYVLNNDSVYEEFMKKTKIEVLYDNAQGSNGNIVLLDSVENYDYIEIFFVDNNKHDYNSLKFIPNGENVSLSLQNGYTDTTGVIHWVSRVSTYSIEGVNVVSDDERNAYINVDSKGKELKNGNYIYITRIVGYKD